MYLYTHSLPGLGKAQQSYAPYKLIAIVVALLMVCNFHSFAQAQSLIKQWDKRFGTGNNDGFTAITQATDGGFLLLGYASLGITGDQSEAGRGKRDYWIVKTDKNGTKLWDKTYGGSDDDVSSAVITTSEGGYLLGGTSLSGISGDKSEANSGSSDIWIVKTDSLGNKLWDKTYGGDGIDRLSAVVATKDGGYLLAGSVRGTDGDQFLLVKIDSTGTKLWETVAGSGILTSAALTNDGGFILAGDVPVEPEFYYDIIVVKTDSVGNTQWVRGFGESIFDDVLASVIAAPDGGYLLAGTNRFGHSDAYWVIKLNSTGSRIWDKKYGTGNGEYLRAAIKTADNAYVLAGWSSSNMGGDKTENSRGGSDYWVVKIDSVGNKLWDKTFGGSGSDRLSSLIQASDKSFLVAGFSESGISGDRTQENRGNGDYWIVKSKESASAEPEYVMSNEPVAACSGTFYDPGYVSEYSDGTIFTQTFTPATAGSKLRFTFHSFHLSENDSLYIYDGATASAPLMGVYTGISRFITTAHNTAGQLTFRFVSDSSQTKSGWIAAISCVNLAAFPALVSQWDKRFGSLHDEGPASIITTKDGGYLLAGTSLSGKGGDKTENSRGEHDYWVVKTNTNGFKLWDKRFGGSSWDYLSSVIETKDGGFILSGYSFSGKDGDKSEENNGSDFTDYWIVKINSTGEKLWDKTYGGTDVDRNSIILQTEDGGFLIGGSSYSNAGGDKSEDSKGGNDYWIIKLDGQGNKLWDKTIGGNGAEHLSSILKTSDGGFLLAGYTTSGLSGDKTQANRGDETTFDNWIVKINSTGEKQWDKTYGGDKHESLASVIQTEDGGYLLAGSSASDISGDKTEINRGPELLTDGLLTFYADYWIVKTDGQGNKEWDKTFGGSNEDGLASVVQTPDGGYLLAGVSASFADGDKTQKRRGIADYWLIKIDKAGTQLWDKVLVGEGVEAVSSAIQTEDGGFLLAGYSTSGISGDKTENSRGGSDYWIVKTTHEGILSLPLKINFQDKYTKTPQGWLKDYGLPFGVKLLADTTYTYGWKQTSDGEPVDLSVGGPFPGNGRWRPVPSDVLQATLMHMQGNHVQNFRGNPTEAYWELTVNNGDYQVTVSVGDGLNYTGTNLESHSIDVEGIPAITHFIPQGGNGAQNRFKQATIKVSVTDGLLTIDANGGTNTKINYASIQPLNTASSVTTARVGLQERLPVVKQLSVYPNPFSTKLIVESKLQGKVNISLYDSMGKRYYQATHEVESREIILDLSTVQMKAGIYLLKVHQEDGSCQLMRVLKK